MPPPELNWFVLFAGEPSYLWPLYNLAMSPNAQKILDEARRLPPSEREWVAHGLLMDEHEEIESEWAAEVESRVADADSPDAPTRSWDELGVRLRARLPQ